MPVRIIQTPCYRLWYHEYDRRVCGAAITEVLGKWTDGGKLGLGFAMLAIIVLIALVVQLTFLRPKTDNME